MISSGVVDRSHATADDQGSLVGLNLLREELLLPAAVLKEDALRTNSKTMRAFLDLSGAQLCPHGKTTMSPELMRRQLADGAWGITAATVQQMDVMRRNGVRRVLIANQVVGRANIEALATVRNEDPEIDLYVLVDSIAGVAELDRWLHLREGRQLQVLVEVGQKGARTGVRSVAQAMDVCEAVGGCGKLALRGVETYEGIIVGANAEDTEARIRELYALVRDVVHAVAAAELFSPGPVLLSGGGSIYYDLAAIGLQAVRLQEPATIVLRSGCYLTHDSGWLEGFYNRMRARTPDLTLPRVRPQAALEVWAYVQSIPDEGRAFATLGKRNISYDLDLPVPLSWFRPGIHERPQTLDRAHRVTALNDQHAYLDLPTGSPLAVGDMIAFGISHPCTTFDKWRTIPVVDEEYSVLYVANTHF